ncbi:hypothetical protein R3P38DRAFT_2840331 [Favolaschia claudopus]|uniref:Peptidase S54 rhomboid domain-containing protein n=1 Tax=Favolaschia claudopus TaxID=2862362 RepID=A0AAW0E075_9AGAR
MMLSTALAALGTPVHKTLFPYPWGPTLHASRISLVFHTNLQASGTPLSWGAHLFGYLLMCWGGSFASHFLLGIPSPQIYALGPWINYTMVHLFFTALFDYFPLPDSTLTNTVLFPLDGLLRANSVILALSHLKNPSVNPLLVASPLFHFLLGAAASSGGGLLGGTLNVWTPNWHFSTPPPLRSGVWGVWTTLDIWAGGVVAATYGLLTAHPAFQPLRAQISFLDAKPFSVRDAKSASAALMILLFGLRVYAMNTASKSPAKSSATTARKPSESKVKTQ